MKNRSKKKNRFGALQARLAQFIRWWNKSDALVVVNPAPDRRKKREFYNGDTYTDLRDTLFHDFRILQIVTASLPDDYVLPNPESVRILLPMTADFYRSLFSSPSVHLELMVDDQIWKRIKAALPLDYKIPDCALETRLF
jgi:hypothetical protein